MTRNVRGCAPRDHNGKNYYCSIELALMMIGGKWKTIILWLLGLDGTLRFGELLRRIPNVTQKMLTQQLRELEADGLLRREAHPQVPPKVEYSLTKRGLSLMPLLEDLSSWARQVEQEKLAQDRTAPESAANG